MKKKKYTIRFHAHTWTDINVWASSKEEAFELAGDKYNEGDYEDQPENYENIDVEDVTGY